MDNVRTSRWKPQSLPWRFAAIGAALAVIFTLATILLWEFCPGGENMMSASLILPTVIMLWPAQHVFDAFGWEWNWIASGPWERTSSFAVSMVFIINALILAVIGAAVGFALKIVIDDAAV